MEFFNSLASKEVIIPVITQLILFALLFKQQTKIGEKIRLEYAKKSIVYQLNQTEYIKQKFERINKLFTLILQNKVFVEQDAPKFISDYITINLTTEKAKAEDLREKLRISLMNTSFYIDAETRDLINDYVDTCERLVNDANSWNINQKIVNVGSQRINQSTPKDLEDLEDRKKTLENYHSSFRHHSLKGSELFKNIELCLKKHLDV